MQAAAAAGGAHGAPRTPQLPIAESVDEPSFESGVAYRWLRQAASLLDRCEIEQARIALQQAAGQAPDEAAFYRGLSVAYRAAGMASEAVDAEMAAIALEQCSASMLYNLATSCMMTRRPLLAEKWYRAALRVDPEFIAAHQNLASILELDGRRQQAQFHRDQAYRRQSVFVDTPAAPKYSALVLCASATGNVPFDYLLPQHEVQRIRWVVEYADERQAANLPPYDFVFNAIGDHDVSEQCGGAVQKFLGSCRRPVLNPPHAVARTTRERIPELLAGVGHAVLPRTERLSGETALADALADGRLRLPLLLRQTGSHGGDGLRLIETDASVPPLQDGRDYYATAFHSFRSADGYCRKYRVIFIDRQPYPYHLAISSHWQVHYETADMQAHAWKLAEEQRFLQNPAAVLGERAWQTLFEMGRRLDLDFCGIDFSLLADGRILVFEANATMLVHLEEFHACLAFKNPYVQRILDAFEAMIERRICMPLNGGHHVC